VDSRLPHVVVVCDRYGELSETFIVNEVAALERAGAAVTVEALADPVTAVAGACAGHVWERESTAGRARAAAWLGARHPAGCRRDLAERRRWRREEPVVALRMLAPAARRIEAIRGPVHLHAHFAAGAALAAMRLAAILDVPFSVTAHGYDIFQRPANLREKLERAAFATSGSDYTVAHLRAIGGDVHRVVMGVDGGEFRRTAPHAPARTVLAVGRLVPKKGFADLIDAVALMRAAGAAPERVTIAGDGPLRPELEARIAAAGVGDVVTLAGALDHSSVRGLMEESAVLCMPCVIAPDGDRDSMPVVVKEALAMEVPVVVTDVAGLPEVVRPQWGTVLPAHDPAGLARGLAAELDRPVAERAARGAAGREFVLAACDVDAEAARLAGLIRRARDARGTRRGGRRSRAGSAS